MTHEVAAPGVSVIIPHFNQPAPLARALAALAAQEAAPSFEVIVVDNGSDAPPESVCAGHSFVRLLSEAEKGPGPARSTGARAARASLLAFLDADCAPDPDWLTRIVARFEDPAAADILAGDVRILVAEPGRRTAIEAFEEVFGYRQRLFVERDHYSATCNMAVTAETFAAVGPFREIAVAEDVDWGRRAHEAGKRIAFAPEIRVATPARTSFAELARKSDRQIGHDYEAARRSPRGRLLWALKAAAMPLSPAAQLPLILQHPRLDGPRDWLGALGVLIRLRLWRARRMVQLLAGLDAAALSGRWRDAGS